MWIDEKIRNAEFWGRQLQDEKSGIKIMNIHEAAKKYMPIKVVDWSALDQKLVNKLEGLGSA